MTTASANEQETVTAHEVTGRRLRILRAAEDLVARDGFDALRLRDVAQAAEVSIGTIQHYFSTRDELLRDTMQRASAVRVERWSGLASGHADAVAQLRTLLRESIADRHRCTVWVETCAAATRHRELQHDVAQTQELWLTTLRQAVESGTAAGEFHPRLSAEEVADLLVKLIDGAALAIATEEHGPDRLAALQDRLLAALEALLR